MKVSEIIGKALVLKVNAKGINKTPIGFLVGPDETEAIKKVMPNLFSKGLFKLPLTTSIENGLSIILLESNPEALASQANQP